MLCRSRNHYIKYSSRGSRSRLRPIFSLRHFFKLTLLSSDTGKVATSGWGDFWEVLLIFLPSYFTWFFSYCLILSLGFFLPLFAPNFSPISRDGTSFFLRSPPKKWKEQTRLDAFRSFSVNLRAFNHFSRISNFLGNGMKLISLNFLEVLWQMMQIFGISTAQLILFTFSGSINMAS